MEDEFEIKTATTDCVFVNYHSRKAIVSTLVIIRCISSSGSIPLRRSLWLDTALWIAIQRLAYRARQTAVDDK